MRVDVGRLGAITLLALSVGCNSMLGPKAPDANWVTITRAHFTFYVRPGSFAERSVDTLGAVMNDQFAHVVTRLGLSYDGHIAMFLHETGDDAGFGGDGDGGNHSGVAYPWTETVKTVAVPPLDGSLFNLLQHEANHVLLGNGLGRHGSRFMNEGMASAVISERFHSNGPTFYHHWVATHRSQIPKLTALVDDAQWARTNQQTAYNASASFLAWLIDTEGASRLRDLWAAESSRFAEAFHAAYGRTVDDAETAWLAYCAGK